MTDKLSTLESQLVEHRKTEDELATAKTTLFSKVTLLESQLEQFKNEANPVVVNRKNSDVELFRKYEQLKLNFRQQAQKLYKYEKCLSEANNYISKLKTSHSSIIHLEINKQTHKIISKPTIQIDDLDETQQICFHETQNSICRHITIKHLDKIKAFRCNIV